jgi:uncharacterized protein
MAITSLKGKSWVVRVIKDWLKNDFNVSIAEVGDQNDRQSLHIGISTVGSNRIYMDGLMSKVVDAIDMMNLVEIVDCKTETLNMGSGDF